MVSRDFHFFVTLHNDFFLFSEYNNKHILKTLSNLSNFQRPFPVKISLIKFHIKGGFVIGTKSTHELLHLPDEFIPYVEDYKIRVYDIAFLSDNVIEQFTSDFKSIARFFKDRRLGIDTLKKGDLGKVRHAEAVLDFLAVFTKDNRYRKLYTEAIKQQEKNKEEIDMCWMLQGWIDEGMEKGMEKGIAKGRAEGLAACVTALKTAGLSFEKTFETITSTETYSAATHEQILNYYNQ